MKADKLITVVLADELTLVREGIAVLCENGVPCRIVGQCGDGEAALRLITTLKPDVAVLELNLPKLFTLEVIRKVREAGLETRLVILSSQSDRKTVVEALRGGAHAYLLKSGPSRHLFDAIPQVVEGGIYVSPLLNLERVFGPSPRKAPLDPFDSLSAREHQVFSLLVEGIRAKEIAARLDLSPKTVDTYRASLMRKLDIHDVAGLVKFAIQRKLTSLDARVSAASL